ncbi:alkyl hydroperoxide reductase/ Thiol specific antioxidant/ Mal allergen [Rhodopirellula maiorica SM1]|uniref:Alkyl hydroperoxide reductase/ Thiol specific antioxidant/ Mal allergen n=1 Tax=Rhodopirellula maiorica SM1 TaxID=1265738 RepID=M5RK38_9BACT|nr:redoxin domain-containing protein [Rhodopirellula maiorica]EMI19688.1 alkyl hydroperoxide reductase/ Thiol specific antioxidant/ Mal allergen [Rhodopirellula maiorica SM1]
MVARLFLIVVLVCPVVAGAADDTKDAVAAEESGANADSSQPAAFTLNDDVRKVLEPFFASINKADVSRVTVEMLTESIVQGKVVESRKSTYQIASKHPDKFTIYLKEPDQRTRIYANGKEMVVALSPEAYYQIDDHPDLQQAVVELPVAMGAYPEPVMALSLAGVDPSLSFLGGMKSVEIVSQGKFRGRVPAVQIHGVQDDAVSWDLWLSEETPTKPLRLLVDLTAMLRATKQVQVPQGFKYQVQFDFLSWRMSGEVSNALFAFRPAKDATEYESLDDYLQSVAGAVAEHPLLGKKAPSFIGERLSEQPVSLEGLKDKVIVLDFWATWCAPCVAAMPVLQEVTSEFADKDVVFLAVNVGEDLELVKSFLEKQDIDLDVVLDPGGKISDAFRADAIPQTVVVGKSGVIESVHMGFPGADELRQRLTDELSVLSVGGHIESAPPAADAEPADEAEPADK